VAQKKHQDSLSFKSNFMENSPIELSEELNALSYKAIGLAIEVHRTLGPGLLESAYQECLIYELQKARIKVEKKHHFLSSIKKSS
jgi:hypothetical protein